MINSLNDVVILGEGKGRNKGRSKKWKSILKLSSVDECLDILDEICE